MVLKYNDIHEKQLSKEPRNRLQLLKEKKNGLMWF